MKTIDEEDWIETYRPLPAPDPANGFDFGEGSTLLGGSPGDLATLRAANPACVWTVLQADDGTTNPIVSGLHVVNRIGHIVTEKPCHDRMRVLFDA